MNLNEILKSKNSNTNIILYGASFLGKLALHALEHRKLYVSNFYDSDERKYAKAGANEAKILAEMQRAVLEGGGDYPANEYITDLLLEAYKTTKSNFCFPNLSLLFSVTR
jgi:hypothetical protein